MRQARQGGYTLVELVVVALIFSVVMSLIALSFNRIVSSSAQIVKAAETDIGGLIGLELLRSDLELAGFGLPWSLPAGFSYSEASERTMVSGCPGTNLALFNDAPDGPPRPVVLGNNVGYHGSDYLVLKGSALGMSAASRGWSYLCYSSGSVLVKPSRSETELVPGRGDRVIVLKPGYLDGVATRELVTSGGSSFSLPFNLPLPSAFRPRERSQSYLVYGVAQADPNPLQFPFNRADYFIKRPDSISPTCARVNQSRGTGTLYKALVNHLGPSQTDTAPFSYPILDCVADLQVVFLLDTNGDGEADLHLAELPASAAEIRGELQEIRVYLLAQQGRRDQGYLYPVGDPARAIVVGDPSLDPSLSGVWSQDRLASEISPDWRRYHWKVYTVVVRPGNL